MAELSLLTELLSLEAEELEDSQLDAELSPALPELGGGGGGGADPDHDWLSADPDESEGAEESELCEESDRLESLTLESETPPDPQHPSPQNRSSHLPLSGIHTAQPNVPA